MHRRKLLGLGLGLMSVSAYGTRARAAETSRTIAVTNVHTGESLDTAYWAAGDYVPDALQALNHVLRDHRTGAIHTMASGLFDLVTTVRTRLDSRVSIQVISGYRSPETNAALHAHSAGVAEHSLHMEGEAMDVRIEGVDLARLRDTAWSLQRGGVGFYPRSQFVHMDVGRVRRWQGV
jgi:uncharacterized protein YcbK (DUF882 family)